MSKVMEPTEVASAEGSFMPGPPAVAVDGPFHKVLPSPLMRAGLLECPAFLIPPALGLRCPAGEFCRFMAVKG